MPLRIRVSMSEIGSVMTPTYKPPLPARLDHARNLAPVRQLPQTDPAQTELPKHRPRSPAAQAARVLAHLKLGRPLPLLQHRLLGHRKPPYKSRILDGNPYVFSKIQHPGSSIDNLRYRGSRFP